MNLTPEIMLAAADILVQGEETFVCFAVSTAAGYWCGSGQYTDPLIHALLHRDGLDTNGGWNAEFREMENAAMGRGDGARLDWHNAKKAARAAWCRKIAAELLAEAQQ